MKNILKIHFVQQIIIFILIIYTRFSILTRNISFDHDKNIDNIFDKDGKLLNGCMILMWHENCTILPMCFWDDYFKNIRKNTYILSSQSRDSEMIVGMYKTLGFKTIRGSTMKKGKSDYKGAISSFRNMVKLIKSGNAILASPDGPRGPAKHVAHGIIKILKITKAPLLLLSAEGKNDWRVNSWDKHKPMRPFAKFNICSELIHDLPENEDEAAKLIKFKLDELQKKSKKNVIKT